MPVSRPSAVGGDDNGFTIIEVLVAIAVISTTMLSLGPLFVITMKVNHQQSNRQSAIQAADDAMERARALQVSALLTGRDLKSTMSQAVAAPEAVKVLLGGDANVGSQMSIIDVAQQFLAYDTEAVDDSGATAALPTAANPITLSGLEYRQSWYVGRCGRATPAQDSQPEAARRACVAGESGTGYTPMYRVIVVVAWTDRFCSSPCTYLSSSLISSKTEEPVFSVGDSVARVRITSTPGPQTGTVTGAVTPLTITADGPQITWRATGLPGCPSTPPAV
jgi:prepilin-type N-terminal cleavage/methylation domain-containing protein